ncbi:MAG: type II toxin-antitoxin system prevent-host-death family antitoxin [Chloroflexi bacterium]|nr:type II toxin-antitoxin system prevent-host-death family antitoxin [Chloroflexota bacterium]
MKTISVTELKARLSEQLRHVRDGEEIVVTDRGRPVAKLSPFPSMDDELARLVARGIVIPARVPMTRARLKRLLNMPKPKDPKGLALKALLEERESGW